MITCLYLNLLFDDFPFDSLPCDLHLGVFVTKSQTYEWKMLLLFKNEKCSTDGCEPVRIRWLKSNEKLSVAPKFHWNLIRPEHLRPPHPFEYHMIKCLNMILQSFGVVSNTHCVWYWKHKCAKKQKFTNLVSHGTP